MCAGIIWPPEHGARSGALRQPLRTPGNHPLPGIHRGRSGNRKRGRATAIPVEYHLAGVKQGTIMQGSTAVIDTTADNHGDAALRCPTEDSKSPVIERSGPTTAKESGGVVPDNNITPGFQQGNQLWKRRSKTQGVSAARRAIREAFLKALTPEKMAKAVRRMLVIINGDDKKAAVAAFKVLTDAAAIRGESDSNRSGPSFVFILPGAGAIPDRTAPVEPAPVLVDTVAALPMPVDPPRPAVPIDVA